GRAARWQRGHQSPGADRRQRPAEVVGDRGGCVPLARQVGQGGRRLVGWPDSDLRRGHPPCLHHGCRRHRDPD
ncbi:MAG: hypothetical protein ACK55I_23180, partial [bacterium]